MKEGKIHLTDKNKPGKRKVNLEVVAVFSIFLAAPKDPVVISSASLIHPLLTLTCTFGNQPDSARSIPGLTDEEWKERSSKPRERKDLTELNQDLEKSNRMNMGRTAPFQAWTEDRGGSRKQKPPVEYKRITKERKKEFKIQIPFIPSKKYKWNSSVCGVYLCFTLGLNHTGQSQLIFFDFSMEGWYQMVDQLSVDIWDAECSVEC